MTEFDVLLHGVTGYTGRIVAGDLLKNYPNLRLCFGGRNVSKMEQVRAEFEGIHTEATSIPLIMVDISVPESIVSAVRRCAVVLNVVGPYPLYGEMVVKACAENGVDYLDASGEPLWQLDMIGKYHEVAFENNARIVFGVAMASCLSDYSAYFMAEHMRQKYGKKLSQVNLNWSKIEAGISGGTVQTMLSEGEQSDEEKQLLHDPYLLNPPGSRSMLPGTPDQHGVLYDVDLKRYTVPWMAAVMNTRTVRRTNALLQFRFGQTFSYSENLSADVGGSSFLGYLVAFMIHLFFSLFSKLATFSLGRTIMRRILPMPGDGPTPEQLESGRAEAFITAHDETGIHVAHAKLVVPFDPGYRFTSIALSEAAALLSGMRDEDIVKSKKGCLTSVACFEWMLLNRLMANAIKWELVDTV